jgi:ABC-type dipeptide/oligopeptide/nickel transport system permease component
LTAESPLSDPQEAKRQTVLRVLLAEPDNGPAWLLSARLAHSENEARARLRRTIACLERVDTPTNRRAAALAQARLHELEQGAGIPTQTITPPPTATAEKPDRVAAPATPRVTAPPPPDGPSAMAEAGAFALILARRLASSLVLLAVLVFFVMLMMALAARGGYAAGGPVLLQALQGSLSYVRGAADGVLDAEATGRVVIRSLGLLATALALAVAIGLPLGGLAAAWRHRRTSNLVLLASLIGVSTPSFFAAMLLIWLNVWAGRQLGIRVLPVFGFGWDSHMILPTLVLAAAPMANITRLGYTALSNALEADHIRTARSKGLLPRIVYGRHVLRTAGVPLLTTIAVSIRYSLAVLPVVEFIFSWRGVGLTLLEAIQGGDAVTAVTMILVLALVFIAASALLDLAYPLIDPRVRLSAGGAA